MLKPVGFFNSSYLQAFIIFTLAVLYESPDFDGYKFFSRFHIVAYVYCLEIILKRAFYSWLGRLSSNRPFQASNLKIFSTVLQYIYYLCIGVLVIFSLITVISVYQHYSENAPMNFGAFAAMISYVSYHFKNDLKDMLNVLFGLDEEL